MRNPRLRKGFNPGLYPFFTGLYPVKNPVNKQLYPSFTGDLSYNFAVLTGHRAFDHFYTSYIHTHKTRTPLCIVFTCALLLQSLQARAHVHVLNTYAFACACAGHFSPTSWRYLWKRKAALRVGFTLSGILMHALYFMRDSIVDHCTTSAGSGRVRASRRTSNRHRS